MLEFIYRLQLNRPELLTEGPTADEAAVLEQHGHYLAALSDRGVVRLAGRTQITEPETFGIVILLVEFAAKAEQIMQQDPAVKHQLMHAQLFPFKTAFQSDLVIPGD